MLVLKRKEGEWVEITHKSGDVLRLRLYEICGRSPARANLAFDDPARNFVIQRPERFAQAAGAPNTPTPDPV
jgi:hypothetical protein